MLRVGLTGGIGAGKSTAARRLAERGAVLVDADLLARDVLAPGSEGLAEVAAAFGSGVLRADGTLDRQVLAEVVFTDEAARARLNAIVHPRVGARTAELVAAAPPDAVVVQDVPLLVENGLGAGFPLVVVVHAPLDVRIRRLRADRGMSEAEARVRIAAQADDGARRAAADVWLDNSGDVAGLHAVVDALWAQRLRPFEVNLRLRRPAPAPAEPVLSDPGWPVQAARLAARVRLACGPRARRVDHVGPTAVPGLAAADVLDLQVSVAAPSDLAGLGPALADVGFPPVTGERGTRTVRYASADPGRAVRLVLLPPGDPAGRLALLVRDWLRSDPAARAGYGQAHATTVAAAAAGWAARSGWGPEADEAGDK